MEGLKGFRVWGFLCLEFFRTCFCGAAALTLPKRLGFRVALLTENNDETMGFHQHFLCLEFFRTCFGGVAALILPKRLGFRVALTKNVDETQWLSSTFLCLDFLKLDFVGLLP